MSDFLQFIDRVPTLPNRKKITHADSSVEYATVEYADEPIEIGTSLNKGNFDILNTRLGFNAVTGVYNPESECAEFTLNELDELSILNNQIVDLQCKSEIYAPADTIVLSKEATLPSSNYYNNAIIELDNGNIMVLGQALNSTTGRFFIMNKNGEIIKSETTLSGSYIDLNAYKMKNGNIIVAGRTNGSRYYGNYGIIDQGGNVVKATDTRLNTDYWTGKFKFFEFENGNILICSKDNNDYGKFEIVKQDGTYVTQFESARYIYDTNLLPYSDKCLIVGSSSSNYSQLYFIVIDENGTKTETMPTDTAFSNYRNARAIQLRNGNYFVCGTYYQSSSPYTINAMIIDIDFNVLYTYTHTFDAQNNAYINCYELNNGNIFFISNGSSKNYFITLDSSLTEVSMTQSGTTYGESQILKMLNGNIIIFLGGVNALYYYIIKPIGEIVTTQTRLNIGTDLYYNKIVELNNGDLIFSDSTKYYIETPNVSEISATLNGIELDTLILKDKYYELVYNESLNKFICEEVRNAN